MRPDISKSPLIWRALLVLVSMLLIIFFAVQAQKAPVPKGIQAPESVFSAHRAAEHLSWVAEKPHPVGTKAHAELKTKLVAFLQKAGLEVQTQKAAVSTSEGSLVWVENIMGRLKGSNSHGAILLACHYDSAPGSNSAADDGAGIASVLEILRALKSGLPLKNDVIFLITDGEEMDCAGAQAFIAQHPWAKQAQWAVNLEARGTAGPVYIYETSPGNANLILAIAKASSNVIGNSLTNEVYKHMPNTSDLTYFKRFGMQGVGLAFMDQPWDYHQPSDTKNNLELGSVQQMGEIALGLVRIFGSNELTAKSNENQIFFNIFGYYFLHYPETAVPWISGTIVLFLLLFLALGFKHKKLEIGKLFHVFALFFLGLVSAILLGWGAETGLSRLHEAWGVSQPHSLQFNPYYPFCLIGLAFFILWITLHFSKKRIDLTNMQVGGMVLWALVTLTASHFSPGLSYLFQWPLLLAILGALMSSSWVQAQLPVTALLLLIFAPTIAFTMTALGFDLYLTLGLPALVLFLGWLILPILSSLQSGWLLGPLSLILIAGGVGMGRFWTIQTFQNRKYSSLQYHLNMDKKTSYWVASPDNPPAFMNLSRPGEPSWQGEGKFVKGSYSSRIHQSTDLLKTPEPKITLLSEEKKGDLRVLRFNIDPQGAKEITLLGEDERFTKGTIFLTEPWTNIGTNKAVHTFQEWNVTLYGPEQKNIETELVFNPAKGPLEVVLIAHYAFLPDWPERQTQVPDTLKPTMDGHSTIVTRVLRVP